MTIIRNITLFILITIFACLPFSKSPATAQIAHTGRSTSADTAGLPKIYRYAGAPVAVRAFLDSLDGGNFLIADPGGKWNGGCIRSTDVPHRQMIWAYITKNSFHMRYLSGGFVTNTHFLTALLKNGRVISYSLDGMQNLPNLP